MTSVAFPDRWRISTPPIRERPSCLLKSGRPDQAELANRVERAFLAQFLDDPAVPQAKPRRPGETDGPPGIRLVQRSDRKIRERGSGMRAAAVPAGDDDVALGDRLADAPGVQIRESLAELPWPSIVASVAGWQGRRPRRARDES